MLGCLIFAAKMFGSIVEPERNVYSPDLINMILLRKNRRDQLSSSYIAFVGADGIFLCLAKGNYIVGFEFAGKFLFYYDVVATKRTFSRSQGFCSDDLSTA